ncbi:MAG: DUF1559 domain-containing protein [Planctomycetes bacterium]|nr:DUF1559 domain-containing protein [Planctomycetota bacterium]
MTPNTSPRMKRSPGTTSARRAFTLIEILVVVAIIAVLVAILIPSLAAAREQARRTLCMSNLHQQQVAMRSYSQDYRTYLPYRGWFSYSISETPHEAYGTGGSDRKDLVNLALLMGKHLGSKDKTTRDVRFLKSNDWDVLYCPTTREDFQNNKDGGLPTLWKPIPNWTWGGYNYALAMGSRSGSPKLGMDVYPRSVFSIDKDGKTVDGLLDGRGWCRLLASKYFNKEFKAVTDDERHDPRILSLVPRGMAPLVIDFIIGGAPRPHKEGISAGYSDGHARFLNLTNKQMSGLGSASEASFELWYYAMHHP